MWLKFCIYDQIFPGFILVFPFHCSLICDLVFLLCLCAVSEVFVVFLFFQFLLSFVIFKVLSSRAFICVCVLLLLLIPSIISCRIYIFPFQEFMLSMQVWSLLLFLINSSENILGLLFRIRTTCNLL